MIELVNGNRCRLSHSPWYKKLGLVSRSGADLVWGDSSKDSRLVAKFCREFNRMEKSDLGLGLFMA
jgi:hypothetical protein